MSELLKINVNDHVEKKNGLTYLSWAWAWAEVLKIDPAATWEAQNFAGKDQPMCMLLAMPDGTAMVGVNVTINGITRSCLLPVMDHKNKAIPKPDAFAVNKNLMRCLAKAIAMHGLGLYIYAGEDLPEQPQEQQEPPAPTAMPSDVLADWLGHINESHSTADVKARLAEGKAVAQECGDTGAYEQMKAAAKARAAAINAALPADCKEGAAA